MSAGLTVVVAPVAGAAVAVGVIGAVASRAAVGATAKAAALGVSGASRAADAVAARQQTRIDTRMRIERASTAYDALSRRADAARGRYGDLVSPLPPLLVEVRKATRRGDEEAALAAIAGAVEAGERQLRDELAHARTARLVAGLGGTGTAGPGSLSTSSWSGSASAVAEPWSEHEDGPSSAVSSSAPEDLAESVRRVFARLDSAVIPSVERELDERAKQVLLAAPGEGARLLDDLRVGVQLANDELAERRARLVELHERLDPFSGEVVEATRRRLFDAADDPEPDWDGLERAVGAAVDYAAAEAWRVYTAEALRESLEELGCEVEEGFDVLLVANGVAHLRRPGWDDLAIRVRTGDGDGVLRFNAVAPRDASGQMDEVTEQGWCATVDSLLVSLAEAGVPLEITDRTQVGDAHVQRVDPSRFPFPRDVAEPAAATEGSRPQADDRRARQRRDSRELRRRLPPS